MDLKKTGQWITTWWGMWLLFFIYTAAAAAFIQLIVLPYFLPGLHFGHGLFVLDSTGFHDAAQEQAKAMMKDGWKAWQLRPLNCSPAGIASIFYYLWCPEPFSVIPFNAVLHATAGCLVFFLLFSITKDRIAAFGGAALFVFNPASLEWTAQIHRDGTFIAGNLLLLVSWLLISKCVRTGKWRPLVYSALCFAISVLMIWASRPYWIQVLLAIYAVLLGAAFVSLIMLWYKRRSIKSHHIASFALICIMLITLMPLMNVEKKVTMTENYQAEKAGLRHFENILWAWNQFEVPIRMRGDFKCIAAVRNHSRGSVVIDGSYKGIFIPNNIDWRFSRIIPDFIGVRLYSIAVYRFNASFSGGTLIDPEVQFMSAEDCLLYLPRALQIGFLSPFPPSWFKHGRTAGTTAGKPVLGIITMFFYICLASFVWNARIYLKDRDFWLVILYNTCGLLLFTYAYPNVGILNRMRYGFYMTVVSMGFAFLIMKMRYKLQRINFK